MRNESRFVTRAEFQPVKDAVERLGVRVEVLTHDVHQLTLRVAEIAEDLIDLRDEMIDCFEALEDRLSKKIDGSSTSLEARLTKKIDDGNAALMSAILSLRS
jgi:uncharacterized protein YoxC